MERACVVFGCRKPATGEVALGAQLEWVCPDHGGPAVGWARIVWDGPAIAVALSAAAIALGTTLLPWLTTATIEGGERTRTLWWLIDHADTADVGAADRVVFMQLWGAGWAQVIGGLVVAGLLASLVLNRADGLSVAAICAVAGVIAAYIAWRIHDAADRSTALVGGFGGSAHLGPGAFLTVAGFVVGAGAAAWMASRPPASPSRSASLRGRRGG